MNHEEVPAYESEVMKFSVCLPQANSRNVCCFSIGGNKNRPFDPHTRFVNSNCRIYDLIVGAFLLLACLPFL